MAIYLKNSWNVPPARWGSPTDVRYAVKENSEKIYKRDYKDIVFAAPLFWGSSFLDYSSYYNDATNVGTTYKHQETYFDGSSYISVANADSLNPDYITLYAGVKTGAGDVFNMICAKDDYQVLQSVWQFRKGINYKLELVCFSGDGLYKVATGDTNIADNKLHHVAGSWNGADIKLYVGGEIDATPVSYAGVLNPGKTNVMQIGCWDQSYVPGLFWDGYIKYLNIIRIAETDEQVALQNDLPYGLYEKVSRPVYLYPKIENWITNKVDGKISIIKNYLNNLDGKTQIIDSKIDDLDGKTQIIDSKIDDLDGKTQIIDSKIDELDGKTQIIKLNLNELDGYINVNESSIDNLDGELKVKDDKINELDGKIRIGDITFCILDGKVILQGISIDDVSILDGAINLDSFGFILDVVWNNGKPFLIKHDVNILELKYWKNGVQNKDLVYRIDNPRKINITNLFNGKIQLKDSNINNLDGNLIIKIPIDAESVLDGAINVDSFGFILDVVWNNGEPYLIKHDVDIIELTYWKNGVQIGDLVYQINDPTNINILNFLNGKIHLGDSNINILDGEILIKSPTDVDIETGLLLDGKVKIQTIPVGLVKVLIS